MKYIVAVSGGVDSVVLLDMLSRERTHEMIVAHFDHGIRPESDADARFVRALAQKYGLEYIAKREELGSKSSELLARERRYAFLAELAQKYGAMIVTAHHRDDLIETIAINCIRGTGWRGLAVFGNKGIHRPLIEWSKAEVYAYAREHSLEWVEDETNQSTLYLRNRVRRQLMTLSNDVKRKLIDLYNDQVQLRLLIEGEIATFDNSMFSRYFLTMIEPQIAIEFLREITDTKLTRPQCEQLLLAIKSARSGTRVTAGSGLVIRFTKRTFIVENTGEML